MGLVWSQLLRREHGRWQPPRGCTQWWGWDLWAHTLITGLITWKQSFVKAFGNAYTRFKSQVFLRNPSCATSCNSTGLARQLRINKYLQINSVWIPLASQERLRNWKLLCGLEAISRTLENSRRWEELQGLRGAQDLVRKSGTQPPPGLTATFMQRSCSPVHLPAHCSLVQAAGEWTQQPGSRAAFLLAPAAQWTGQRCSHQGGGTRACRSGQPASQCDVHSDATFSTEEDVNLQGEAAKFPMGTYVCEAGRPALAALIYLITIDHLPSYL